MLLLNFFLSFNIFFLFFKKLSSELISLSSSYSLDDFSSISKLNPNFVSFSFISLNWISFSSINFFLFSSFSIRLIGFDSNFTTLGNTFELNDNFLLKVFNIDVFALKLLLYRFIIYFFKRFTLSEFKVFL